MFKLLVIEDDPLLQKACLRKFSEDFEVFQALDGKEGLAIAIKTIPDFILLDLMLPELSGILVLEELKKRPETEKIPVGIFSAVHPSIPEQDNPEIVKLSVKYWRKDKLDLSNVAAEIKEYIAKNKA